MELMRPNDSEVAGLGRCLRTASGWAQILLFTFCGSHNDCSPMQASVLAPRLECPVMSVPEATNMRPLNIDIGQRNVIMLTFGSLSLRNYTSSQ
jgi:hypothetical protein